MGVNHYLYQEKPAAYFWNTRLWYLLYDKTIQ